MGEGIGRVGKGLVTEGNHINTYIHIYIYIYTFMYIYIYKYRFIYTVGDKMLGANGFWLIKHSIWEQFLCFLYVYIAFIKNGGPKNM